jgi:multisubunit Na+/H+ antiporter MnhB subunit
VSPPRFRTEPSKDLRRMRPPGSRSLILETSVKWLFPSIFVLGIYFLFVGHNLPGGGFVGGLLAGTAVALRYVAGGTPAVAATFRAPPELILGVGLATSALTAGIPVLFGNPVLDHGAIEIDLPIFHEVRISSTLIFDIGVFFVVVGLIVMATEAFGDDDPKLFAALDERDDPVHGDGAPTVTDVPPLGPDDVAAPVPPAVVERASTGPEEESGP